MCSRVLIPAPTLRVVLLIVRVEHPAEAHDRPLAPWERLPLVRAGTLPVPTIRNFSRAHFPLAARVAVLGRALAQLLVELLGWPSPPPPPSPPLTLEPTFSP